MLDRLAKLAHTSARLRQAALQKESGLATSGAKLVGKGLMTAGKAAIKNPGTTLTAGLGGMAAVGSFRQYKSGFNFPVPPGTR